MIGESGGLKSLNLTAIIGVRTTESTSQDMEHFREVLAGNLTDTEFNVTVSGVVYGTNEESSPTFTVVETCEPGFIKVLRYGVNHCSKFLPSIEHNQKL